MRRRPLLAAAVIVALAGAAAGLHVSLCPFATLTGLPCPSCGILRSVLALVTGNVAAGLHTHPLAVVAVPAAVVAVRRSVAERAWSVGMERCFAGLVAVIVSGMLVVWVLRFQGALGGPVAVNSIWSRAHAPSPVAAWLGVPAPSLTR